jgi:hypothetical protein
MVHRSRDAAPMVVQTRARLALFLVALALGCDFRIRCAGDAPANPALVDSPAVHADASASTPGGTLPNHAASP